MTAEKSTNWESVALRTLTGPDACHSLKVAERGPVGAHSLQALSSLLGAPGGLSAVISAADRSGKNRLRAHGSLHLAQHSKLHKLAREGKLHKLAREGKLHKLREAVSVTNCADELATFSGQKCNDQNTLWEGQGMIRMPDTIRNADGSAPIDKFRLSFRLVENDSHSQEILSSTNELPRENDSHSQERGGKIEQGTRYAPSRTLDTELAGSRYIPSRIQYVSSRILTRSLNETKLSCPSQ